MFMERIEVPVIEQGRPLPVALKLGAGIAFCLFALAIMPPYFAAVALWLALAAGMPFILRTATTAWQTILHAGELIVGR